MNELKALNIIKIENDTYIHHIPYIRLAHSFCHYKYNHTCLIHDIRFTYESYIHLH